MRLDPRLTFERLVIGVGNRLAAAAARAVAESPGTTYNPLFLYGGSGLGKTHLITAAAHRLLELQPGADELVVHARTGAQSCSAGTSTQRRSFQLCSAASTSCTPLAPSGSVQRYGASSTTWRMKASHCSLKPLS